MKSARSSTSVDNKITISIDVRNTYTHTSEIEMFAESYYIRKTSINFNTYTITRCKSLDGATNTYTIESRYTTQYTENYSYVTRSIVSIIASNSTSMTDLYMSYMSILTVYGKATVSSWFSAKDFLYKNMGDTYTAMATATANSRIFLRVKYNKKHDVVKTSKSNIIAYYW